jgi:hypothetical protein
MIKQKEARRLEIDLTGPDGNAFVLLGHAVSLSKQLGLDKNKIMREMQKGDYEHLIKVFDKYFGEYVDLVR